ncbi:hypothetical protein MAPG_05186 [Magnaporthiopsis poae ATCC 64411]|uniref:Uncharacterized protein n=1 Tax=Magnaporthiopsis poae (strain ATCC 64411 / 73-15) TaxID=644358 RepID=A0A0C4DYR0_MAGP6|nr:hypothetical protein MAPG_05186 [Magnaporthiopsis poae ATCC 64411]
MVSFSSSALAPPFHTPETEDHTGGSTARTTPRRNATGAPHGVSQPRVAIMAGWRS